MIKKLKVTVKNWFINQEKKLYSKLYNRKLKRDYKTYFIKWNITKNPIELEDNNPNDELKYTCK